MLNYDGGMFNFKNVDVTYDENVMKNRCNMKL